MQPLIGAVNHYHTNSMAKSVIHAVEKTANINANINAHWSIRFSITISGKLAPAPACDITAPIVMPIANKAVAMGTILRIMIPKG